MNVRFMRSRGNRPAASLAVLPENLRGSQSRIFCRSGFATFVEVLLPVHPMSKDMSKPAGGACHGTDSLGCTIVPYRITSGFGQRPGLRTVTDLGRTCELAAGNSDRFRSVASSTTEYLPGRPNHWRRSRRSTWIRYRDSGRENRKKRHGSALALTRWMQMARIASIQILLW